MKNLQRFVLPIIFLSFAILSAACNANVGKSAYEQVRDAHQTEWDNAIEEAGRLLPLELGVSSIVNLNTTPKAFYTMYKEGPEAACYFLDKAEKPGEGEWDFFLVTSSQYMFQIGEEAWRFVYDEENHFASNAAARIKDLRAIMKRVPETVKTITGQSATEETLEQLNQLGLLAAPYVADRIRQGETEWTPYFETQLLGLTAEERFEELVYESKNNISDAAELYARRREVAGPVDAAQWIEDNAETLAILREITG